MSGSEQMLKARREVSRAELLITYRGDGLTMASFDYVCIAVWDTQPTPMLFEIQRSKLAAAVLSNPGRQMFLCVVSSGAAPPDQELREASAKMITTYGSKLAACACVIEGSGFRSAITRTVLTGITLLIRTPSPVHFFESVASASDWLEKRAVRGKLTQLPDELALARRTAAT